MRARRAVVLALAGAGVLACLVVTRLAAQPPGATNAGSSPAVSPAHTQPTDTAGAPAPSLATARDAAVGFATASQNWLYLSNAEIDRAVLAIATPGAGPRLAAQTVADMASARQALSASSGSVWWLVRPLAVRVERFHPPTARVQVWVVTVLCAPGVALPQANWEVVTAELGWAPDTRRWEVASVSEDPGPTPLTSNQELAWGADAFDSALAGYQRVGSEGGK